jgi:hypothetical protein
MKRVRVSPGKFVFVSQAIVDKAARVFASGAFTREQVLELAAAEPKRANGVMLGKSTGKHVANKPLPTKSGGGVAREPTTGRIMCTGGGVDRMSSKRKAA